MPAGEYGLAARFLLPEAKLGLCREFIHAFGKGRPRQIKEIQIGHLESYNREVAQYVPLVFLRKDVAPDLEVTDDKGEPLPIPAPSENVALTLRAFADLAIEEDWDLVGSDLRPLVQEVIQGDPFRARVARLVIDERANMPRPLKDLLRELEDQFVLWMKVDQNFPVDRGVRIVQRQVMQRAPLIVRHRRHVRRRLSVAGEEVEVQFLAAVGLPRLSLHFLFQRLRLALGTYAVFEYATAEAPRFEDFRLRIEAPPGFLVRDAAVDTEGAANVRLERPEVQTIFTASEAFYEREGISVGGIGSESAYLNAVHPPRDLSRMQMRVAFAMRSELIGFWALVIVLTAGLLWLFHRAGVMWIDEREGALETATTVLLLGPSAASALALRADEGGWVRRSMWLTRMMLFGSALLAMGTALVLLFPASEEVKLKLIGDFAACAYVFAALISVIWVSGQDLLWSLYRSHLKDRFGNYVVLLTLCLTMVALAALELPSRLPALLAALPWMILGVCCGAVAVNRALDLRGRRTGAFPFLAVAGTVVAFLAGGLFAGFYGGLSPGEASWWLGRMGGAMAMVALIGAWANRADREAVGTTPNVQSKPMSESGGATP